MRTIVTGIIAFVLWTALSTWYYVTHIKGTPPQEATTVAQPVVETAPEESQPAVIEPVATVESPGSFAVYHAFDRSAVIPDETLDRYVEQLLAFEVENREMKVNLIGHTDALGPDDYNYRLGLRRAQNTRDYLMEKGIPATTIDISSKGETQPVATNETDAGRAQTVSYTHLRAHET